jgi:hypothetical protein
MAQGCPGARRPTPPSPRHGRPCRVPPYAAGALPMTDEPQPQYDASRVMLNGAAIGLVTNLVNGVEARLSAELHAVETRLSAELKTVNGDVDGLELCRAGEAAPCRPVVGVHQRPRMGRAAPGPARRRRGRAAAGPRQAARHRSDDRVVMGAAVLQSPRTRRPQGWRLYRWTRSRRDVGVWLTRPPAPDLRGASASLHRQGVARLAKAEVVR